MSETKQKQERRKGYWVETNSDGVRMLCFKPRHGGKKDVHKLTLKEIEEILKKDA